MDVKKEKSYMQRGNDKSLFLRDGSGKIVFLYYGKARIRLAQNLELGHRRGTENVGMT
jgi:hypothetical protein